MTCTWGKLVTKQILLIMLWKLNPKANNGCVWTWISFYELNNTHSHSKIYYVKVEKIKVGRFCYISYFHHLSSFVFTFCYLSLQPTRTLLHEKGRSGKLWGHDFLETSTTKEDCKRHPERISKNFCGEWDDYFSNCDVSMLHCRIGKQNRWLINFLSREKSYFR